MTSKKNGRLLQVSLKEVMMNNMPIYFVTGNADKFREAQSLIPELERVEIDLPEEQTLDPQVVIEKKLEFARSKHDGPLIVEDTSLYFNGLNGFPGPLIKWMEQAVGNKGIYDLLSAIKDRGAEARTVIGYDDGNGSITFFEGRIDGHIIMPSGIEGFGWDEIFQPNGLDETFAEMGDGYKSEFSMRTIAFRQLAEFLNK